MQEIHGRLISSCDNHRRIAENGAAVVRDSKIVPDKHLRDKGCERAENITGSIS